MNMCQCWTAWSIGICLRAVRFVVLCTSAFFPIVIADSELSAYIFLQFVFKDCLTKDDGSYLLITDYGICTNNVWYDVAGSFIGCCVITVFLAIYYCIDRTHKLSPASSATVKVVELLHEVLFTSAIVAAKVLALNESMKGLGVGYLLLIATGGLSIICTTFYFTVLLTPVDATAYQPVPHVTNGFSLNSRALYSNVSPAHAC